jgi:16S rRNA processing protein RimM
MNADEGFMLGTLTKPHGLKGELKVTLDVRDAAPYRTLAAVYVETQAGAPLQYYPVESFREQQGQADQRFIIKLRGVDDRDEAHRLQGKLLFLPLEQMAPLPQASSFYYFQIEGYQVVDEAHGALGAVEEVEEMPAQDLLRFRCQGQRVLVPLTDEFVLGADHAAQELHTRLPEGLLEIYLGPSRE